MEKKRTDRKPTDRLLVKCPHCGCEYHMAEIFSPGEAMGKPENVIRDPLGKVLYVEYEPGEEPIFGERFECESCGKPFEVAATVSLRARKAAEESDFSVLESSLL